MAIDTLLFDLDGTLVDQVLPGSTWQFSTLVIRRFADLAPPWRTWRAGGQAVRAMKTHRSELTNYEALVSTFCREARVERKEAVARLEALASTDFAQMAWRFSPIPGAREAVLLGRALGFRLVLATNPTVPFPMTLHRLAWADLADIEWAYITQPERMTRSKPDVEYYTELLARLDCTPERCLMIGNDFRKDLPAMEAGIRTFLLDRPMSAKARKALARYTPDHFGTYDALCEVLRALAAEREAAQPTRGNVG